MFNLPVFTVLILVPAIAGILWGGYVYAQSQGWKLSWRGVGGIVAALFWAVPVVAVVGYMFVRTAPQVQPVVADSSEASATSIKETVATDPTAMEIVAVPDLFPSSGASETSSAVATTSTTSTVNVPTVEKSEATRPAWVDAPHQDGMVVVVGKPNLNLKLAEEQALNAAWMKTVATLHRDQTFEGSWRPQPGDIQPLLVGEPYVEAIESRTGNFYFTTHRVFLRLDLSASGQERLRPVRERQIVHSRLWVLGGWLGMLTLIFGTTAAYLRLDDMTDGMYRLRLKFAATSLIVSGGFVAAVLTTG